MNKLQCYYSHLKTKLEGIYNLTVDIQGLYLDQEESEEVIENWKIETGQDLE